MDKSIEILNMIKKLKHGNVNKEFFLGLVITLILSKEIFKKNSEVALYLDNVFKVVFLPYTVRSRTLISAKISRVIIELSNKEIENLSSLTVNYIINNHELKNEKKPVAKNNKKGNALSNMDKWIEGILKKE
ncbi:hypothetical protein [Xenorhabdus hominickii]|uniref:Uncharacterized protein n=1 Tax=Xenorhabdus hominickii TaxID=351679 RepID=A0A2G0Q2K5_XENHO|nr:hypothetical protein [Xenorhabdus hominickii]AOM39689.1 hypothetical protein A9255_03240 [Xenorhabdus hominickii]PHM53446.1 hypothetical protein Xhom_03444 [Xenorhabdus hominickii]